MHPLHIVGVWRDERDIEIALALTSLWNRYYVGRGYARPIDLANPTLKYRREPVGQEHFATLPVLEALGAGDCDDLASAVVGSYPNIGRPIVYKTSGGYHAVVELNDGRILDPSAILVRAERGGR